NVLASGDPLTPVTPKQGLSRSITHGKALPPRRPDMLSQDCLNELQSSWLPNISDAGLDRLIELLGRGSPLLIHGCFTRAVPMGCLATQVAWHPHQTAHLTQDAGITWLYRVAGLNPATSQVIREWDLRGPHDLELRADLLELFRRDRELRQQPAAAACPEL